jgi:uncharacterized protein
MIEPKTEKIIKELLEEIKSKYSEFRGIYLFGSRARGDFDEDSDYDLAFVFDREISTLFKDEIRELAIDKELEFLILIDSHIFKNYDILNPVTPFRENIKNEGVFYDS